MFKPGQKQFFFDYSPFLDKRDDWLKEFRNSPNRFVRIQDREDRSAMPYDIFKAIEKGKYRTNWRGIGMSKDPLDLGIFAAMLWDLRPRTIIELGVLRGGSVVWFADHAAMFGLDCRIIGFDMDYSNLHDDAKSRKDITYLTGDCTEIEKSFTSDMLKELEHPWLIVEDAHAHLEHVLSHFNKFMKRGDYIVVEDTNPCTSEDVIDVVQPKENVYTDATKLGLVRAFLEKHSEELQIDTMYNDLFGFNVTFNVNGYIRKM